MAFRRSPCRASPPCTHSHRWVPKPPPPGAYSVNTVPPPAVSRTGVTATGTACLPGPPRPGALRTTGRHTKVRRAVSRCGCDWQHRRCADRWQPRERALALSGRCPRVGDECSAMPLSHGRRTCSEAAVGEAWHGATEATWVSLNHSVCFQATRPPPQRCPGRRSSPLRRGPIARHSPVAVAGLRWPGGPDVADTQAGGGTVCRGALAWRTVQCCGSKGG